MPWISTELEGRLFEFLCRVKHGTLAQAASVLVVLQAHAGSCLTCVAALQDAHPHLVLVLALLVALKGDD